MATQIIALAILVMTAIIGLWKWYWGRDAELRKLRQKELDNAKNASNASDLNSSINDISNGL